MPSLGFIFVWAIHKNNDKMMFFKWKKLFNSEKKKSIEAFVVAGKQEGRKEVAFAITTYLMVFFQTILFYFWPSGHLVALNHAAKHISVLWDSISYRGACGFSPCSPILLQPRSSVAVPPHHHLILLLPLGHDFSKCKVYSRSVWPPCFMSPEHFPLCPLPSCFC